MLIIPVDTVLTFSNVTIPTKYNNAQIRNASGNLLPAISGAINPGPINLAACCVMAFSEIAFNSLLDGTKFGMSA